MKSFRIKKTKEQIAQQAVVEEKAIDQLSEFFSLLSEVRPAIEEAPALIAEESVEVITEVAEEIHEEILIPTAPTVVDVVAKSIKESVFELPDAPKTPNEVAVLSKKVTDLQNWITKVAMTGPGSGEVNFRYLDDVNRASIGNTDQILRYNPTDKKFFFGQLSGDQGAVKSLLFGQSGAGVTRAPGMLSWNQTEDCLDITHADGTTLQTGYEQYIQIKNNTGSILTNGTVVQFAGVEDGDNPIPTISKYIANDVVMPLYLIGVMTNDVANGQLGRATVFGKVHNLNTTGSTVGETWTAGTLLWGHPTIAGAMTSVRPTAPNVATSIAAVLKVGTTDGVILVRPTIFPRLFYGDWYSTSNQTHALANTPYRITIEHTGAVSGFTNNNGVITAQNAGLYNFQFSFQIISTNSSPAYYWIWYRKNGVDAPNSATKLSISSNSIVLAPAWNFPVSMHVNDTFELMWACDTPNKVSLSAQPAQTFCPAIPSVILTTVQANL